MSMDEILDEIRGFEGVLELAPQPGSEHPEIAWGDYFFYFAPDGVVPSNRQPYATIITKDYPDDTGSRLDPPDRWRLNIHVGRELFADLLGYAPDQIPTDVDFGRDDAFIPHPVYGAYGWAAVVNPGPATQAAVVDALRAAHAADRRRVERRTRDGAATD